MRQLSHDPLGVIGLQLLVLPARFSRWEGAHGSAAAFSRREAPGEHAGHAPQGASLWTGMLVFLLLVQR